MANFKYPENLDEKILRELIDNENDPRYDKKREFYGVTVIDDNSEKEVNKTPNFNDRFDELNEEGWKEYRRLLREEGLDGGDDKNNNTNKSSNTSSPSFKIKRPAYSRGGILRYPMEAMTDTTDYLQIDIKEYTPIKNKSDSFATIPGKRRTARNSDVSGGLSNHSLVNKGTVLLQIPANIQDGNAVQYGESKMNTILGAALGGSIDIMEGMGKAMGGTGSFADRAKNTVTAGGDAVKNAIEKSGLSIDNAAGLITKQLAAGVASVFGSNVTINQILARESGQIFNPNMELLFDSPTLRNFRFSFKMTPRSKEEAEQIRLIIRTFKMNMSAKVTTGHSGTSLFLDTPSVFELRYKSGRNNHPFLHKFKQCFLQDISVNYTAEGVYATYENKEPVSMIMDLTFKELEPIYNIDYIDDNGSDRDNTVGY